MSQGELGQPPEKRSEEMMERFSVRAGKEHSRLGAIKPGAEVWVWRDVGTVLCRMLAVESSEVITHSLHNFSLVT